MAEKINELERLRLLLERSNSAWYMYYTDGFSIGKRVQTYCNIHGTNGNSTTYTLEQNIIPEFHQKYILSSIHGWLILAPFKPGNVYKFSISNPFTLQTIHLPPLTFFTDVKIKCAFRSPPDSDDCVLLVWFTSSNAMFSCRPARPDCYWTAHSIQIPLQGSVEEILTVNGVMYVITTDDKNIYRLDMNMDMDVDADASLVLRPLHIRAPDIIARVRAFDFDFDYYVESCGQIYCVKVGLDFDYVKVFELDFNGGCWREIRSLGGRTFFVANDCCTWCWGTTDESWSSQAGIQRNCIYIHRIGFDPFYIYNLQDDSLFPLWPCPNVMSPTDQPVWVIPQHLRLSSSSSIEEKPIDINRIGECNDDDLEESCKFLELPLEMVQEISKQLHLYEYWNFRATSTMIRSLCPAPQWKTNNQVPLFLFFKKDGTSELIDPCGHGSRFHSVPFFSDPFDLRFSNNGWVLAMVGKSLQYFNFFTGSRGEYPNPPAEDDFLNLDSIAFSTNPTCSDCLTIGINGANADGKVEIRYLEAEKGTWDSCLLENEIDEATFFNLSESCPIFLAGAFYILDMQGILLVFQLVNGKPTCVYAIPQNLNMFHASHLVESEGELYSVFIDKMGQRVQVFKFDKLMKHWIEVESLENHVFFISRASSFSIVTTDQRLRNRIYFPRLYKKGLLFYSLDTRKFHSLTSDDTIEDFYGTSEPLRCCWV